MREVEIGVVKEVYRWRFLLGRHISFLCDIQSDRTKDRLLQRLIEENYLSREKILYGIPYLYTASPKGKKVLGVKPIKEGIRIDRIRHDITVLDSLQSLMNYYKFDKNDLKTERELLALHISEKNRHCPDFAFIINDVSCAVEFELSIKSFKRLQSNVQANYLNYDKQIWIVPQYQVKIIQNLKVLVPQYTNMEVLLLENL